MDPIEHLVINGLDHVAIRVKDLEASALWYHKVLGLKKYHPKEWQPFPILMLAGKSGIALFPANINDVELNPDSKNVKIDHFAFHVDHKNFELARKRFARLHIEYRLADYHYFHSIFITDPDGHTVELTTIVVDENSFY